MAVKIPPQLIVALIVVILMVFVVFGFFSTVLFGGPEIQATKDIAEVLQTACEQPAPFTTTFNTVLPNSKQGATHKQYYYMTLDNYNLSLQAKNEANDIIVAFVDYVRQPQQKPIKTIALKSCMDRNIRICSALDSSTKICGPVSFGSTEGQESLTFTVSRTKTGNLDEVTLSYTRAPVCGDNLCCTPETSDNCPIDCSVPNPHCTTE